MLCELHITNFALIDSITISFTDGLNVFTGATGVGKSLIMGALNFLLGSRIGNDIVRTDQKEARVSGVFFIKNDAVRKDLEVMLNDTVEEEVILQRSIDRNGRNKSSLNSNPITVTLLKEIGNRLVNIHGQHEHESLIEPSYQLSILDRFGNANEVRNEFSSIYRIAVEKERYLNSLKENESLRKREIDLCRFEVNEIENAAIKPGESDALEEEQNVLANSEKIKTTAYECFDNIYEADNSIIERLREIATELEGISSFDKHFTPLAEGCNQSIYQLEEISVELRKNAEKCNVNPERLSEVEERLDTIQKLCNKYGNTIDDVLAHYKKSKKKLEQLVSEDEDLENIEEELCKLRNDVIKRGNSLTKLRTKAATKLSKLVKDELGDLSINNGQFEVEVSGHSMDRKEGNLLKLEDVSSSGFDDVEFMFSANAGEKVKPLRKIASGGEMSRVILVLKRQLAMADNTPVLVFDEIDSNIGGRMGKVVGEKLKTVSDHHQIICITHLPQIASYADQHMKVDKKVAGNKTSTEIYELSEKEQMEEIADMIRGDEKSNVTRKQAKEMINDAKKFSNNRMGN